MEQFNKRLEKREGNRESAKKAAQEYLECLKQCAKGERKTDSDKIMAMMEGNETPLSVYEIIGRFDTYKRLSGCSLEDLGTSTEEITKIQDNAFLNEAKQKGEI